MKIVRSDEGRQVQVLSDKVCIKLASSESPRKMAVVTVHLPVAGFVPPHMHAEEEEGYYILEGVMTMQLGDGEFEVGTGDFVHVPQGTVHGYRNDGTQLCRFLAWTVGGAIDQFFIEMSDKIKNIPGDLPKMPEILSKYGICMTEPSQVPTKHFGSELPN